MASFKFHLGQKVHVDGDTSLTPIVTAQIQRDAGVLYECCWFNHGDHHRSDIEESRLTDGTSRR